MLPHQIAARKMQDHWYVCNPGRDPWDKTFWSCSPGYIHPKCKLGKILAADYQAKLEAATNALR